MNIMKTVVLFIVAAALLGAYIMSNHFPNEVGPDEILMEEPQESGNPEGALSTCLDRQESDSCSFTINDNQYPGVCQDVMGTLTCGPDPEVSIDSTSEVDIESSLQSQEIEVEAGLESR